MLIKRLQKEAEGLNPLNIHKSKQVSIMEEWLIKQETHSLKTKLDKIISCYIQEDCIKSLSVLYKKSALKETVNFLS